VASKSVRCRALIERVLAKPGWHGVMAYTLREAVWLVRQGVTDDVLVAYPTVDRTAIAELTADPALAAAITIMVDHPTHLDVVDRVTAPGGRPDVRLCIDLDSSWKPAGPLHVGVRRSPVHSAAQAAALARRLAARPGFQLVGMMSYEAQIAGVIGHEIAHVVLRHGTNQASKGDLLGGLAGAVGGLFGGTTGQLASAGGAFAANMTLLRYSRDAESQADLMGTQILYDLGYAPRSMAEFFDKLAKEHRGSSMEQFFSNHPIPENRVAKVSAEIKKLGPELTNPKVDTPEFQRTKKILLAMPEPKPKAKPATTK